MPLVALSHFFTNLAGVNVQQAKDIDINDLLLRLGHQPTKQTARDTWYKRPYGQERHASFHVSRDGRAWFDFGTGKGGNIIDLAMHLAGCRDVSAALAYIEALTGQRAHSGPTGKPSLPEHYDPGYRLDQSRPLADPRGEDWCDSRGLDLAQCRPYLQDVYFNRAGKPYKTPLYGVGLPNLSGGFEIRTKLASESWVKSSVGPKDITVFKSQRAHAPWFEFEGIPDFCTFLTLRRPAIQDCHFLILHGTGQTRRGIEFLETQPAGVLQLCPQHGSPGSMASCEAFRLWAGEHGWAGKDIDYPGDEEDYNAWYMAGKSLSTPTANPGQSPALRQTPRVGL